MIIGRKIFIHFLSKGYDVDDDDWRAMAFARISFTPNPKEGSSSKLFDAIVSNQWSNETPETR